MPVARVVSGDEIADEVEGHVLAQLNAAVTYVEAAHLKDIVYETIYREQHRLQGPPTPRTHSDEQFLAGLRRRASVAAREEMAELVRLIVRHYAKEISGHFDPRVYQVATRLLPPALSVVLHGMRLRDSNVFDLANRVSISGNSRHLL